MPGIPADNLILQGQALGSKEPTNLDVGRQVMGLYRGGSCDKMKVKPGESPIQSWRPYPNSIMRGYKDDTIYPIYEQIIVKHIESKIGRRLWGDELQKTFNFGPLIDPKDCPTTTEILNEFFIFEDLLRELQR